MFDFLDRIEPVEEKNYRALMIGQVEPYLEKRRREGFFTAADGQKLHYEAYDKVISRGIVVILHGFTESAEKFREVTYYFTKAGYEVFALDLRGHGRSCHESKKTERVEIDSFEAYADDLNLFIENVVRRTGGNRRIYIYSHSLGSTVALLYLMKYPYTVEKAVLSSPMICGNMGMPTAVAGAAAKLLCLAGGNKVSAPGRCVFNAAADFENSDATSRERYLYYHEKRKKEPLYQTSGPSFGWVKASLEARDRLLSPEAVSQIRAKLMIFKPQYDKQLLGEYTDRFAFLAGVEIKNVRHSRHEIFMSSDNVLSWYFGEILEFYNE